MLDLSVVPTRLGVSATHVFALALHLGDFLCICVPSQRIYLPRLEPPYLLEEDPMQILHIGMCRNDEILRVPKKVYKIPCMRFYVCQLRRFLTRG